MAGRRMLHNNICVSKKLSSVSFAAETLYYRLLTVVDDDGNFSGEPRVVHGHCMALRNDVTPEDVSKMLHELSQVSGDKSPLILFYKENNDYYIHINRFEDFQQLRKDRQPFLVYPTHPKELGPSILSVDEPLAVRGKPLVNQSVTSGKPVVTNLEQSVGGIQIQVQREVQRESKANTNKNANTNGDWRVMRNRFRNAFGFGHSDQDKCKDEFQKACMEYGEDFVLEEFGKWATDEGQWIKTIRYKSFGLTHFYKILPELLEAKEFKNKEDPELSMSVIKAQAQKQSDELKVENDHKIEILNRNIAAAEALTAEDLF